MQALSQLSYTPLVAVTLFCVPAAKKRDYAQKIGCVQVSGPFFAFFEYFIFSLPVEAGRVACTDAMPAADNTPLAVNMQPL
ncbi:MAG: hypothetical protein EON54_10725, partial [Alcaligenaceae bacterium]